MVGTEKLNAALEALRQAGMRPEEAYPWLHRLLRRFGVRMRPPAFVPIWQRVVYLAIFYFIWWMLVQHWIYPERSLGGDLIGAALFAGGMSVFMAFMLRRRAAKFTFPSWNEIEATEGTKS